RAAAEVDHHRASRDRVVREIAHGHGERHVAQRAERHARGDRAVHGRGHGGGGLRGSDGGERGSREERDEPVHGDLWARVNANRSLRTLGLRPAGAKEKKLAARTWPGASSLALGPPSRLPSGPACAPTWGSLRKPPSSASSPASAPGLVVRPHARAAPAALHGTARRAARSTRPWR